MHKTTAVKTSSQQAELRAYYYIKILQFSKEKTKTTRHQSCMYLVCTLHMYTRYIVVCASNRHMADGQMADGHYEACVFTNAIACYKHEHAYSAYSDTFQINDGQWQL